MGQGGCPGSSKVAVTEANGVIQAVWSVDGLTFTQSISLMNTSSNESGTYGFAANPNRFTDIGSHWAKNDIAYCAAREIFKDVSDIRFNPNDLVTRTQMCTLLKRFAEQQGYMLTAILSAKQ